MDVNFRIAQESDLPGINRIYNQAIEHRHQTADLEKLSLQQTKDWFDLHEVSRYPVFILEAENRLIGWSSLSGYRKGRQALASVAEISYYIDQEFLGKGYGKVLIQNTIAKAKAYSFDSLVAILLDTNIPSKSILLKYGFSEWGRIKDAANIEGQRVDHLYFGLKI